MRQIQRFATVAQTKLIIKLKNEGKTRSEILQVLEMANNESNQNWLKGQIHKLISMKVVKKKNILTKEEIKQIATGVGKPLILENSEKTFPTKEHSSFKNVSYDPDDKSAKHCSPGSRRYTFVLQIETVNEIKKYACENNLNYGSLISAILKKFLEKPFHVNPD